ncbi:axin [Plutella xylostella]|uniref:axin n=1 Tax=Plutella xylostella TaxID=51655 RepID=UPI002032CEA0|nr:axin [Plutella xylostella]
MSHTPVGGHPQGWEHKLADRASLPPASGEERRPHKHVFTHPHVPKGGVYREETEGSSASSARSPASPPYLRWARTLHALLEDEEGVRLFRSFVSGAGKLHTDRLDFYFAVLGLRQETEQPAVRQTVAVIYKFLRKSQLAMPEQLKAQVKQALKDGSYIDRTIFDDMEQEVTRAITESTYQAFLRSEAYVSYVSASTQPLSSRDASPPALVGKDTPAPGLATLHEGQELGSAPARLTHDALLATQSRRLHSEQAPKGSFGRSRSVYSHAPHLSYAGYCTTSRQDSERASLSSGRTDSDAISLSGSSVDGMSLRREGRESSRLRARLHGPAPLNKEMDSSMVVIPRTQRMQSEQLRVLPPAEFAPLLIERLERVKREQDSHDRLDRRLAEGDGEDASTQALPPQLVAAAIREKLQVDDDNDQDILDQHVSRVWSERTPGGSPPPRARRRAPSALSADSGHHSDPYHQPRRGSSKKTGTSLTTDSGVSVVSSRTSASVEPRVLLWMAQTKPAKPTRNKTSGGSKSSGSGSNTSDAPCTVVVMTFLDEAVPYRIKVPASPLTLRVFKEYLPRKGNYRYFFKTECADLDNTVIQEEVSNDGDVLPMFEGKVMARVKSVE